VVDTVPTSENPKNLDAPDEVKRLPLKKPRPWNIKRAEEMMNRLIDENQQWLKDMANR